MGVDLFQHIVSDVFDVILHCDFGLVQLGLGGRALSGVQLLRRKNLIIYGIINPLSWCVCMYDGQTFSNSGMAPFTCLSFQPFSRGSASFYDSTKRKKTDNEWKKKKIITIHTLPSNLILVVFRV